MRNTVAPIFEFATSPLYTSNDGRLKVEQVDDGWGVVDTQIGPGDPWLIYTEQRELADAYIAGYDQAKS
jgi:hypothetical protein